MRRPLVLFLAVTVLAYGATAGLAAVSGWRMDTSTGKIYGLTSSAPWATTEAECVAAGGHLAKIDDPAENKWLQARFSGAHWVGLRDDSVITGQPDPPGDWFWVSDGSPVTYSNWGPGEPNGGSEDHGDLRGDGKWNDLNGATNSLTGICELDTAYPIDRVRFNPATGNVYARSAATNLTWETAEFVSQAAGGNLATINDQAETDWVAANFGGGWIGYNDVATEGTFVWSSGQTPGYTNWNPGEPNNSGNEDYTEIVGTTGRWNDLRATHLRRGIAEIETNATVGSFRYNPTTQHIYAKTNNLTFNTAELVANAMGANLATINDANENEWVRANMGGGWIGFNDDGDEGTWTWTSGTGGTWDYPTWSGTSYEQWYNAAHGAPGGGEPNGGTGENLGEIRSDGYWNDLGHSHTRGGIIEFPTAISQTDARYNPATGHIYLKTNAVPWEDAERFAQTQGGHLAAVGDAAENDFVRSFGPGWIGFHDKNVRQQFEWANGEAVTYQNWNSGEPNGGDTENYGEVMGNGLWNDLSTQTRAGIIELPTNYQIGEYRYNPFTEHVYARTNALPWAQAQFFARTIGGDLVTMNGAGENNWLQGQYSGDNWIGFYDVADTTGMPDPPGDWRWSNGEPVTYTNWAAPGEPNGASEDHATLRGDQRWNDLNGVTNSRRAIVEFPEALTIDAEHYNPATGKVYLKSNSVGWEAAERLAQAVGGHLATINDAGENEYVAAATRGGWIGATDRFDEGNFTWVSGDTSTYTHWAGGEPNNAGGNEDYATMRSNGEWNDYSTQTQQGIIELNGTYSVGDYRYNSATGHVYARTNAVDWQTGEIVARAAGGHLAEIGDGAENAWVNSTYGGTKWIGLIDVTDFVPVPGTDPPGVWAWSTGNMASGAYENWAGGEPNGANEDAGSMRSDGLWNDLPDNRVHQAIVEFDDAVPNPALSGQRYNPATDKLYAKTASTSWRAAELIARVNNGHLATVNDAAENAWLHSEMSGGWIGINDDGHEGGWVWSSGEGGAWIQGVGGSSYTNWHPGEPNNSGGEHYAELRTDNGQWNDLRATHTRQGIVEMQARTPQWRFNPGSGMMNAQTDDLMWEDAELQAQNWGGHLATVPNATANEFIRTTWGGGWIGFTDKAAEGNFVWVSGKAVTYTNWRSGEPNNSGGAENYTTMTGDGLWNDYSTQYQNGVAERKPLGPRWVFNPATNRFYALTDNMIALDAEEQAKWWGGHLATINDAAENDFLDVHFGGSAPWIGFSDQATEGTWAWHAGDGGSWTGDQTGGSGTSYVNWAGGEPNNAGNEDFAQLRSDGLWNDLPGDRYVQGIAEVQAPPPLEIFVNPDTGKEYVVLGRMTWEEAELTAQELGGHLVTIMDQDENDFIRDFFTDDMGLGNIWIGATDKYFEGVWQWANPTSASAYTNWNPGPGEPNGGLNENYGMMYTNGLWNDANGQALYYAVMDFVPEPGTALVLCAGLIAVARRRRRRR